MDSPSLVSMMIINDADGDHDDENEDDEVYDEDVYGVQDLRERQPPRLQILLLPSSTFSEEHSLFMDTGQHHYHHHHHYNDDDHQHHHHHHAFPVIRYYVRVSFLIQYSLYKNIACFTGQVPSLS